MNRRHRHRLPRQHPQLLAVGLDEFDQILLRKLLPSGVLARHALDRRGALEQLRWQSVLVALVNVCVDPASRETLEALRSERPELVILLLVDESVVEEAVAWADSGLADGLMQLPLDPFETRQVLATAFRVDQPGSAVNGRDVREMILRQLKDSQTRIAHLVVQRRQAAE